MTIEVLVSFDVKIKEDVLNKIEAIVSGFDQEFSGFLIGTINDKSIEVEDIIFPNQTVSSTSVDIDAKDVIPLRNDARWKNLLGMWHSHVRMGTFWSGEEGDESHIRFLSQDKPVSLFIVSSFKDNNYEHKVRVEISAPFKLSFDNIPLKVIRDKNYKLNVLKEIKQYIKEKPVQTIINSGKRNIKFDYNNITKILTISNISYQECEIIKKSMTDIIDKTYYSVGWNIDIKLINPNVKIKDVIKEIKSIVEKPQQINNPYFDFYNDTYNNRNKDAWGGFFD